MLADVAEMPGSALPAIFWDAQESALLPVLLSRGASDSNSEGSSEPLELSLMLALADPSMSSCVFTSFDEIFAPAAHEDTWVGSIAPLLTSRLLGRMSLPPLSSEWQFFNAELLSMVNGSLHHAYFLI